MKHLTFQELKTRIDYTKGKLSEYPQNASSGIRRSLQIKYEPMGLKIASIDKFVVVLKQSGLLDESVVNESLEEFGQQVENSSAESFSGFLVERNLITKWHAAKLLKGKHKGFFLGKYKLLNLLGKGGMSSVYLAEHTVMRRQVAIKVLPYKLVTDSSYLERFYREAQAVAALDDPNIVRAYDVDHQTEGTMQIHFLVMEYVKGHNIYEVVKNHGVLSPAIAADYVRQGALGLHHAHEAGMVHRDIKPGNFIVDGNGTVKLMDLGLAIIHQEKEEFSLTEKNQEKVLGTADYLAPEQAVDSHKVDSRADIYALGCTFYFMLSGEPPFNEGTLAQRLLAHQTKEPKPLKELRPELPDAIVDIISRMMIKDPEKRTQSAAIVADELDYWLKNQNKGEPQEKLDLPPVSDSDLPAFSDRDDEINDFLSQLHDQPELFDRKSTQLKQGSGAETTKESIPNKQQGAGTSDSAVSIFGSSGSSIVGADSSRSLRRSKSKKTDPIHIVMMALVAAILVIMVLFQSQRDDKTGKDDSQAGTTQGPQNGSAETPREWPRISGTSIHIGPAGDFDRISTAIEFLRDSRNASSASSIKEIRVAADQTFSDSVSFDGFGTVSSALKIIGEGPNYPVIQAGETPAFDLRSAEQLEISNLVIDCKGADVGVHLEGYLAQSSIADVTFKNIGEYGILAEGVSGLGGRQLMIERCKFEGNSSSAKGIEFSSSDVTNTRQVRLLGCRFIGPMQAGVQFESPQGATWDIDLAQCIFHKTDSGIAFSGAKHDVSRVKIANNTFHETAFGVNFVNGPNPACSEITFLQNLFVNVKTSEVATERQGVSLDKLSAGAVTPQSNWTTGAPKDAQTWLNIFGNNGKTDAGTIEFVSTDPTKANFLKPRGNALRDAVTNPIQNRKYIGAISP